MFGNRQLQRSQLTLTGALAREAKQYRLSIPGISSAKHHDSIEVHLICDWKLYFGFG